jgi:hypothetical protein
MTSGFGDYDRWKTTPPDDSEYEICNQCGGNLVRDWHKRKGRWICERCDDENEYRERQLDEQGDEP